MMEKMEFDEFANVVVNGVREWLPKELQQAEISLQVFSKNNEVSLTALVIRCTDSNIAPTIYLEKFYEQYMEGESLNDVLREIAKVREVNDVKENFDTDQITKFDLCRDKIMPRLIGANMNENLLKKRPHMLIADLAVIFCINLECDVSGTASITVSNEIMENWGITTEELYKVAVNNLKQSKIGLFEPMSIILKKMMYPKILKECEGDEEMAERICNEQMPPEDNMYVLTNKNKVHGASMLLDSDMMAEVIKEVGPDFFILPSSVHEVLIVPADKGMDSRDLEMMVREVNDTEVSDMELLSYHVYRYTLENGIEIA